MTQSKLVRKMLKQKLVPLLETQGFRGKFPDFQRIEDQQLHLLSVEFDKYGGGFFIEIAVHPSGDFNTPWGEVVAEKDLTVAHTNMENRARLQHKGHNNSLSEDWFRFEGLTEQGVENLVVDVCAMFPQINAWLRNGTVGNNMCAV